MADSTTTEKDLTTIKISAHLATTLRIIAVHRGITIDEAVDAYGGPGINKEHRTVLNERRRKDSGESGA